MTHFTYITSHLLPSWVHQWTSNFKLWADLMTNDYEAYANPWGESPERECYEWFWASLNTYDILSKVSLESFYEMIADIDAGIVETIPAEDVLQKLEVLIGNTDSESNEILY